MLRVVLSSLFVSFLALAFNFLTSILFARLLGPELRGEYGSIIMIVGLIGGISQFGLGHSYIYCRRKFYSAEGILAFFLTTLVTVLFTSLLFTFLTEHLIVLEEKRWVLYVLAGLSSVTIFLTDTSRLQASLKAYNLKQISCSVVTAVLLLFCYVINYELTPLTAIYITLLSLFSGGLVVLPFLISNEVVSKKINFKIDWTYAYLYGFKSYGTSVVGLLVTNFDKIFLLFVGGALDFGVYIVAYNTSRLIGIVPQTLSNVIFSKFAGVDESKLASTTSTVFSLLFTPMLTIAVIIAISGGYFIPFLFGSEYSDAVLPFSILVVECVISGLGWVLAQRFTASGRPGLVFLRQAFSMLPLLFLFVYMPPYNIGVVLASMMLLAAILRLLLTMYMYPKVFQEARPSIIPWAKDVRFLINKFKGK
jgi:antigen flippase